MELQFSGTRSSILAPFGRFPDTPSLLASQIEGPVKRMDGFHCVKKAEREHSVFGYGRYPFLCYRCRDSNRSLVFLTGRHGPYVAAVIKTAYLDKVLKNEIDALLYDFKNL